VASNDSVAGGEDLANNVDIVWCFAAGERGAVVDRVAKRDRRDTLAPTLCARIQTGEVKYTPLAGLATVISEASAGRHSVALFAGNFTSLATVQSYRCGD
jgi:hypothetical protein